jgi:hypothetical protein
MSSVHHSPTISSVWAMEQFISANEARRMSPRLVGCVIQLNLLA